MVVTCQIDFDNNPYGTYFAGQVVTGKVTLTADKPKKVNGIALKIYGYAKTHWSKSSSQTETDSKGNSTSTTKTTYFRGREDYIASVTYLMGSDADQSYVIAPGIHTYNFACHIPAICPSSFEGLYGHIRYFVRIALIRPWKFDQTYTKGFTVLKIMDLNYESPILRLPANIEVQKTFCCGPCQSEPMKIHVTLPQSGFVPGQNIPITLTVTNDSNAPVKEINITLFMLVCFNSQTPHLSFKNDRVPVSKLLGEGVLRHCKKVFSYELPVPATPPTCFNLCRIIQIAYEVYVEAKVKGFHTRQVLALPVTIGNVPLMGVINQQPISSMHRSSNTVNTGTSDVKQTETSMRATDSAEPQSSVPWSSISNIPPPSYEEAMHVPHGRINEDEKNDFGECEFAPRYPVFSMTNSIAQTENNDEVDGSNTTNGTWL